MQPQCTTTVCAEHADIQSTVIEVVALIYHLSKDVLTDLHISTVYQCLRVLEQQKLFSNACGFKAISHSASLMGISGPTAVSCTFPETFSQSLYVESSEKGKDLEPRVNELHSTWRNGFDFDAACKPQKTEPSIRAELMVLQKAQISLFGSRDSSDTRDSSTALGRERDTSALLYRTKAP